MHCPVPERGMVSDVPDVIPRKIQDIKQKITSLKTQSVSIIQVKHTRTIWPAAAAGYHNDILDRLAGNFTKMGLIHGKEAKNGLTH